MDDLVLIPMRGSVHVRPMAEVIPDCRCGYDPDDDEDHGNCLLITGARWPEPTPYAAIDDEDWTPP